MRLYYKCALNNYNRWGWGGTGKSIISIFSYLFIIDINCPSSSSFTSINWNNKEKHFHDHYYLYLYDCLLFPPPFLPPLLPPRFLPPLFLPLPPPVAPLPPLSGNSALKITESSAVLASVSVIFTLQEPLPMKIKDAIKCSSTLSLRGHEPPLPKPFPN